MIFARKSFLKESLANENTGESIALSGFFNDRFSLKYELSKRKSTITRTVRCFIKMKMSYLYKLR